MHTCFLWDVQGPQLSPPGANTCVASKSSVRTQAELESGVGGAGGALGTHLADGLRLPSGYLQLLCQRMAAAVSLKRASFNWATGGLEMLLRPELMAALDLKSAHGARPQWQGSPQLGASL